jgi:excisionase family DNA binding protein
MRTKPPARPGAQVSVAQLAEHYGVHPRTVFRWIDQGLIPAYRVGRKALRIDFDKARKAIESQSRTESDHAEAEAARLAEAATLATRRAEARSLAARRAPPRPKASRNGKNHSAESELTA